jgi:AraC-like DNA-binding protein
MTVPRGIRRVTRAPRKSVRKSTRKIASKGAAKPTRKMTARISSSSSATVRKATKSTTRSSQKDCRSTQRTGKIKLMKMVAVFLSDDTTIRRLTVGFRNRCAVRPFETVEAVRHAVAAGNVLALIVDMRRRPDTIDQDPIDVIHRLHTLWPNVPVIGYVNLTPQHARAIMAAARAGANDIILSDFDELDKIANQIVDTGMSINVALRVESAITGLVPQHLHEFFLACITNARTSMSVDAMALQLRKSRKTLSSWLTLSQLPQPARIIGWGRVLVAARMLEDTTQSAEKIARDMQFMSGTAMRNMMRRYLQCGPEVLRQRGGFSYALDQFLAVLERSTQSPPRSAR